MSARIPKTIRENVVREWLKGTPRDENTKINGIGNGTMTSIIQESLEFNPEFVSLREVATIIKKEGMDIDSWCYIKQQVGEY